MTLTTHPRANSTLYGQQDTEKTLLDAWHSGKMPHAWLLSGPKGIGKATLAYRFIRFVLSGAEGSELALPSSHPTFQRITAGGHGDLLILEEDSETGKDIKVDEARKISHFLHLTASETSHRIVLIDSVDHMNTAAANSILKLLEEPPAHALIFLISHTPGKLLPTIRSRCRHIRMPVLSGHHIEKTLHHVASEYESADIRAIAPLSEGSAGFALELLAHNGLDIYRQLMNMLADYPRLSHQAILTFAAMLGGKKTDHQIWDIGIHCYSWLLARCVRFKATAELPPAITGREAEVIPAIAVHTSLDKLIEIWENTGTLAAKTDRIHLDKRVTLVNMFEGLKKAEAATV